MDQHIRGIYREPFSLGTPMVFSVPSGICIDEIVGKCPLPVNFSDYGEVRINDATVPRALWGMVKPKPSSDMIPIDVTFHMPARGGGGGEDSGGKDVLAMVAGLALTIATGFIAGGGLAGVFGASFGAGTIGATALAAGVSLIGSLLIGALAVPPALETQEEDTRKPAGIQGNVLRANGPIPRVVGTRKIYPPLGGEPYIYYDGEDEYAEAMFVLSGPHDLSDIRLDGSSIDEAEDIEYEVREGWPDDLPITIVTKQAKSVVPRTELSRHIVDSDNQDQLLDPDVPENNVPVWHGVTGRYDPDELVMQLVMPEGLNKEGSSTNAFRIPFRIRMREQGSSTWINLPEVHYLDASQRQERATVRFLFQEYTALVLNPPPTTKGWVEARKHSPGQVIDPVTGDWDADAYFSNGSGDDVYDYANRLSTNVINTEITGSDVRFYLDPDTFGPAIYEFEIKRGCAIDDSDFVSSAYTLNGELRDPFYYRGSGTFYVPEDRKGVADACYLVRLVSTWNEPVVNTSGLAIIAIRARNRSVENLSVYASGYVRDWGGSAWDTWTTTSNPAPHFRDVLTGDLNFDPLPEEIIDDDGLVTWRASCTSLDYTCDMVVEGSRVSDALKAIAGCGYARPYQSEIWGVIMDYDRSAEDPVQIFSPRNSSGFKFKKAFGRLPDGLRINFHDETSDEDQNQIIQYREGDTGISSRLEQVDYLGLKDEAKLRARATFDMRQGEYRSTFYEMDVPAESIRCRRGSLVGVQHDILSQQAGQGRITAVATGSGNVTGVTLDSFVPTRSTGDMHSVADMHAVDDMAGIGLITGAAIRQTDGTITVHEVSNADGETNTLTFATPFTDTTTTGGPFDPATIPLVDEGCLVVVGQLGSEYLRLIIASIIPNADLTASLTMVDEAPEIWE